MPGAAECSSGYCYILSHPELLKSMVNRGTKCAAADEFLHIGVVYHLYIQQERQVVYAEYICVSLYQGTIQLCYH